MFATMRDKPHHNPDSDHDHRHFRSDLQPYNDGSPLSQMNVSPQQMRFAEKALKSMLNVEAKTRHDMGGTEWRAGDEGAFSMDGSAKHHKATWHENLDQMSGWRSGDDQAFSFSSATQQQQDDTPTRRARPRCTDLCPQFGSAPADMAIAIQERRLRRDPEGSVMGQGAGIVVAPGEPKVFSGRRKERPKADNIDIEIGLRNAKPVNFLADAASPEVDMGYHGRKGTEVTEMLRANVLADPDYNAPVDYNRSLWRLGEKRPGGVASGSHVLWGDDGANLAPPKPAPEGRFRLWERREFDTTGARRERPARLQRWLSLDHALSPTRALADSGASAAACLTFRCDAPVRQVETTSTAPPASMAPNTRRHRCRRRRRRRRHKWLPMGATARARPTSVAAAQMLTWGTCTGSRTICARPRAYST